jgi:hypothetical protein
MTGHWFNSDSNFGASHIAQKINKGVFKVFGVKV